MPNMAAAWRAMYEASSGGPSSKRSTRISPSHSHFKRKVLVRCRALRLRLRIDARSEEEEEEDELYSEVEAGSYATSLSAVRTFVRLMGSLIPIRLSSASVNERASAP